MIGGQLQLGLSPAPFAAVSAPSGSSRGPARSEPSPLPERRLCPACARQSLGGAAPSAPDTAAMLGVSFRDPQRYAHNRPMSLAEAREVRQAFLRGACARHMAAALSRRPGRIQRELVGQGLVSVGDAGRGRAASTRLRGRRAELPQDEQIKEAARRLCLAEAARTLLCGRVALAQRAAELGVSFQSYKPTSAAPEMLITCPACGARATFWCVAVLRSGSTGAEIHSFHKARTENAPLTRAVS